MRNQNQNATKALDEAIVTFFQIYRDTFDGYARMGSHTPKPVRDISEVKGDYLKNLVEYGLELRDQGMHPDAVEILLEYAVGTFLERCQEKERADLRLQLLYAKKALLLIWADPGEYVYTTAALAGEELDLSEIYQYFKAVLKKKEEGVKYVYSS